MEECHEIKWNCNYLYIMINAGFQFDYVFDWTILKYQQRSEIAGAPPHAIVSAFNDIVGYSVLPN